MIKAVLLDVDNTLLDFNKCALESMLSAANDAGITLPENIFDVFHEINTGLWHDIEKGKLTREELLRIRWKLILEKVGIDYDGEAFEKLFIKYLWVSAVPMEGAIDLLEYLSPKYTLCIASNAGAKQQENRLKNAGMYAYIEHMFISEEIGYPKPSTEFFTACYDKLKEFKQDEIIMIGDSLSADINGAHDFGFVTCWFNYDSTELPSDLCADYTVTSLDEIKNIL